jgi:LacI family transcriptional regulator
MPTIREVAGLAGVAPITVSRVINNAGYVSAETRHRVEEAIRQSGYVPNTLARSFRWKQTGMLALVLTDITNPFWTTVARGVEDAASDAGLNLILCNTDESASKQDRYLQALAQKQVDGVLLVPVGSAVEPIRFMQRQEVPVVVLDRRLPEPIADVVRCDSEQAAYRLVWLLLNLGHRRIALLNGPAGVSTAADRLAGYRRALAEAGLGPEADIVYYGAFTVASGHDMACQALAGPPDAPATAPLRPTACFAANNFIAIGALKALAEAGLVVPGDMAVVGFDDLPPALVVDPFLTVAVQPAYEMGRKATELLLARMSAQSPPAFCEIVLPAEIVERRSTAPARS